MNSADYLRFKEEIRPYMKMLRDASQTIMDQDVSRHPIFVLYTEELELGIKLTDRNDTLGKWSVNASTLEEFVARQLVQPDKVDNFKSTYKDPETHLCLFVVDGKSAEFVFLPKELTGEN
ncbi:MAG: hypothetical protein R3301_06325 [Saprospiraceae bacterium]|nr:hypothetical protein [Saprospiraceae bacterium]